MQEYGAHREEQEWQQPWEKLDDDGSGPAEIVIVSDETGVEEPKTAETATENAQVRDIGATASSKVVEHTPPKAVALEGEIVPNNKNRGSREFFDQPLAEAKKVCIVGDASEATRVDHAVYQVAQTIVENADTSKGNGVIIAARFAPAPDTILMKPPEQTKTFTPVAVDTTKPDGLYSVLKGDQIAEAVAKAAGGDNERAVTAYDFILRRVTEALTTRTADEETGHVTAIPPTLAQVRDGVRWLREMYTSDVQQITREQRDAVKNSIPKTAQAQNQPFYEPLGQWLDKAIANPVPGQAAVTAEQQPNQDNDITLVNIAVKPTGQGLAAKAERGLLSQGLVPLIAEQTPWGRPEAIILTDIDRADPDAIREIERTCRAQNIPLIVTVGAITEQIIDLVQADLYGITKNNPLQASMLATKVLGTAIREDPTSRTTNIGYSDGYSTNTGDSENFKLGSGFAESSGISKGASESEGRSEGISETVSIGEGPRFRAAELGKIPQRQIAIISATGESYGLYNIGNRNRQGEFPLSPPKKQLDVSERLRGIGQQSSTPAIGQASAPPVRYHEPTDTTPKSSLDHLQPSQRLQELRMTYSQYYGRPQGKEFEQWCRQMWAREQEGRMRIIPYDEWIGRRRRQ